MAITHCIEDFQLDIAFNSEALARREQGRLAQWLSDDLLPALDVLFSNYSPGQKRLRFERLEFDLGQLRGYNYQQQIKQQLIEKLSELLRERRLELPARPTALLSNADANNQPRALVQLVLFLRTGQLPWHSDDDRDNAINFYGNGSSYVSAEKYLATATFATGDEKKYHQQLLSGLLNHSGLPDALRAIPEREQLLQRLVSQFPDEQLSALLKKFAPAFYRELAPLWQLLSKWRDSYSYGGSPLKQLWWKAALRLWLNGDQLSHATAGSITVARAGWPAKLLRQLAQDINLPTTQLYKQLFAVSRQLPVDASSEFIRYLRGTSAAISIADAQRQAARVAIELPLASETLTSPEKSIPSKPPLTSALSPHPSSKKSASRELRYQLAQIFNGAQGEALALLWPELLARHTSLLQAALNHYLAIPAVRQQLALQFPLDLLGDIFAFLQPEWELASLYKSFVQELAINHDIAATIERDLWEISINYYVQQSLGNRAEFLSTMLGTLAYRQGLAREAISDALLNAGQTLLTSNERKVLVDVDIAATVAPANARRHETQQDQLTDQPQELQEENGSLEIQLNAPILVMLQQEAGRSLTRQETHIVLDILAVLTGEQPANKSNVVASNNLKAILDDSESLSVALRSVFFAVLIQQWPEKLSPKIGDSDWQLLVTYALRHSSHSNIAGSAASSNLFKTENLTAIAKLYRTTGQKNYAQLFKHILSGEFFTSDHYAGLRQGLLQPQVSSGNEPATMAQLHTGESARSHQSLAPLTYENSSGQQKNGQTLSPTVTEASDAFTEALQDQADVDISHNHDLRWQEFLRQLQRGSIALGDLHLNDSSGVQIIAHYLSQAGHIKAEYRQNLLASISSMSRRASDTADYFRRIIHCLIYQQPLDFDEILTSKDFWQEREKSAAPSRAHKWDDAVVAETVEDNAQAVHLSRPNSDELSQPKGQDVWEGSTQDYDQQFWVVLQRIKNFQGALFQYSLSQLQQLVEFYLINSPELADTFRRELAVAIAKRATALKTPAQRFNYYANLLRRLVTSADIDVDAAQLLEPAEWVQPLATSSENLDSNIQYSNAAEGSDLSADKITSANNQETLQNASDSKKLSSLEINKDALTSIDVAQLARLQDQLQNGEVQLDQVQLSEQQWRSLAEMLVTNNNQLSAAQMQSLLSQLSVTDASNSTEYLREWVRGQLQTLLVDWKALSPSHQAEPSLSAFSLPELISLAEVPALTQAQRERLWTLMEPLTKGVVKVQQLQASLPVLIGLTQFLLARLASSDERAQIQAATAVIQQNEIAQYRYYSRLLQTLVDGNLSSTTLLPAQDEVVKTSSILAVDQPSSHSLIQSTFEAAKKDKRGLSLFELLAVVEASGGQVSDEGVRTQLLSLGELIASGQVPIDQLQASFSQMIGLVDFFSVNRHALSPSDSEQLKIVIEKYANQANNRYQYFTDILYALVRGAGVADITTLISEYELAMNSRRASTNQLSRHEAGNFGKQHWSLAELLAVTEASGGQVSDEVARTHLLSLGECIASGQIQINKLQASLSQLRALVDFFVINHTKMSSGYAAQLRTAIEKYAALVDNKHQYFAEVLQKLLRGLDLDLEKISAQASQLDMDSATQAVLDQQSGQPPSPGSLSDKTEPQATTAQPPTLNTNAAQPHSDSDQSLLELLLLPSLTSTQSIRLQQLLQTLLKRGDGDAIRLWFNPSLGDEPLLRLIELLPDYALHQLLRLAQPAAYGLVYPQAKHVLDVFEIAAPGVSAARTHRTKWLFILQHSLHKGSVKPDDKILLDFVRQLASIAAISDITTLETLLLERLALSAGETKTAQEKSRAKAEAEELLQEALEEGIHISNAGQVLAAPYMGRLFAMLQLTDQGQFVSLAAKDRAIHLLEYMVTGSSATPEYDLLLNKVLCGMSTSIPISAAIEITEQEEIIIGQLLNSIIQNWKALGSTSITGLRETFLRRQGWLRLDEDGWHLRVQSGPFDMLLDQLPWSFSLIKHGWMDQPLRVSWRE